MRPFHVTLIVVLLNMLRFFLIFMVISVTNLSIQNWGLNPIFPGIARGGREERGIRAWRMRLLCATLCCDSGEFGN
jgi:hypothetical protein